ncbi:MAG: hypothetical protein ACPIOQ_83135, partial [Promethearchaeia archaeon]
SMPMAAAGVALTSRFSERVSMSEESSVRWPGASLEPVMAPRRRRTLSHLSNQWVAPPGDADASPPPPPRHEYSLDRVHT